MVADPAGDPATLFSLRGKTAVVTGGSRGIGFMITQGLLQAGAAKVYISARKAQQVDEAVTALSAYGTVVGVPADLATDTGVATLVAAVEEDALPILVNNAGATWGEPLGNHSVDSFDKVLGVNVKAVFALTQALLPKLRAAGTPDDPARVVNVGSVDGRRVPLIENYAYSASKAGVHMLTRHLALQLAADAVTVNAIAPGPFDSKMMAFLLDDPAARTAVASQVPLGRVGRPDDVAGAAIFLCSRAGAYLTGTVIPVDGGIGAR